jgi:hypothetical protein
VVLGDLDLARRLQRQGDLGGEVDPLLGQDLGDRQGQLLDLRLEPGRERPAQVVGSTGAAGG